MTVGEDALGTEGRPDVGRAFRLIGESEDGYLVEAA